MTKPKKQKQSYTRDDVHKWAVDHILNSLLDGNLRTGIGRVVTVAIIWGRQNPEPKE